MRLRFILSETFKGLTRNLAMTVSVILVAFISLLFVGASALLQAQISTMKGDWYDKVEVSVYMCPASSSGAACPDGEATQEQIDAVESFINSDALKPYVKSYTFESKAEAYAKFKEVYGERPIGRNATEDMMPVSFRIKLIDAEKYQAVAEQLTGRDGVERVVDQRKTLESFFLVMNRASWITGGLAAIMAVAAVLLISTTIRLSAMSRSKETGIMRLVGASRFFIQLPFMLEGAIAALIGAFAAVGALWAGVYFIVDGWLAQSLTFINTAFVSTGDVLLLAPWLLLAAIVLAVVSSSFSPVEVHEGLIMASLPPLSEASAALSKVSKATRGVGRQCYRTLAGKRRLLSVLMVIALAVVPLGMTARADDRSDAVDQQNEAQKRQTELASSLEGVSAELGQAYLDLQSAETALTTAEDDLTTAESTLSEKEREQQTASDRLDVAEADLTTVTEEADASQADASESNVSVADLVVSTYQGDSSVSSWSYVLSSSDTVDDLNQRASTMEIAASIQETVLASAEAERAQDANRKARQDAATDRVSTPEG